MTPVPIPASQTLAPGPVPEVKGQKGQGTSLCIKQVDQTFFLLPVARNQLPCYASFPELESQRDTFCHRRMHVKSKFKHTHTHTHSRTHNSVIIQNIHAAH